MNASFAHQCFPHASSNCWVQGTLAFEIGFHGKSRMATFEVANEQLAAIQDFLDVQRRLGMALPLYDEIENQQACTLARVIARLKSLTAVDAQTLSATLARGNWGATAKAQLAKVISERVGAQGHAGNGTQECEGFANYPTEDEWRILMDPSMPRLNKVHAVVDRMLAINLWNPSEQCRKLIASIIGMYVPDATGKELPDDIRFWIQKKRKALKKIASREDIPMIIEYPHYAARNARRSLQESL